ncbi:MAG: YicC/YloC family endoribonuclease [Bacteroidota bacterium]
MTGYGRAEATTFRFKIKSEVRTLNSKFLDFTPRLPKELNFKETQIRNLVSEHLKRGKVMLTIELELDTEHQNSIQVDKSLFKAYYEEFLALSKEVGSADEDFVKLALGSPEVISQYAPSEEEIPWNEIEKCLIDTLAECNSFRRQEGETLAETLTEYLGNIHVALKKIEKADENRTTQIRAKLSKSLEEISDKVKVDQNRFEQELIFYLERLDISEEKVRLKQHLEYFEKTLQEQACAGKKLGFIAQEIGREINTIGSKANHAEIQQTVVDMKDDLEKIKEQILNII